MLRKSLHQLTVLASLCLFFSPLSSGIAQAAPNDWIVKVTKISALPSTVNGLAIMSGELYFTQEEEKKVQRLVIKGTDASSQNWEASDKRITSPRGISASPDQSIYVADREQNQIFLRNKEGHIDIFAGSGKEGLQDGPSSKAKFHGPSDVAIAPDGSIYVADTLNHRIRKIDVPSGEVSTVAGSGNDKDEDGWLIGGYKDGQALEAQFNEPHSIAFDRQGHLYIADTGNQRIRKLAPNGTVTTVAGSGLELVGDRYFKGGYQDGQAATAQFNSPLGISVSDNGTIYVADTYNNCIRAISPQGMVTTVAGNETNGNKDSWGVEAQFDGPTDVAVSPDGTLFVADHWNQSIRQLTSIAFPDNHSGHIRMVIDQKPLILKQSPALLDNQTFVPLREIAEALGYQVMYDPKQIKLQKGTQQTVIPNKNIKRMGGKTLVSIREIGNLLQVDVNWLQSYRMIELTTRGKEG